MKQVILAAVRSAIRILADGGGTIDIMRNRLLELHDQSKAIIEAAEGRTLNAGERETLDSINAEWQEIEANIKLRETALMQEDMLAQSRGRQTQATPPVQTTPADEPVVTRQLGDGRRVEINDHVRSPAQPLDHRWGWQDVGQFALAVARASRPGATIDNRLLARMGNPRAAAPAEYGREGVGEDGGFAVPPEFRTAIQILIEGEASLLSRTDQMPVTGNSITFPVDETSPWGSSGIQSYWDAEAEQMTPKKPSLRDLQIRLSKLTTLVPVTDELLEDAPAMTAWLMRKAPEKMIFKINRSIVAGTGAGQPLGVLNSPALVTVSKESGPQTADTIVVQNIVKMYSRMYAPLLPRSVWLVNQDIYPQLMTMTISGASSGVFPVFLPPGGVSTAPYGTLMGRPIIPTEACETIGDLGDILFVDLTSYMTAMKVGGIRQDVSMHLWFDYGISAYRFVLRIAGQPWWSQVLTPRSGVAASSLSPFIALEAR